MLIDPNALLLSTGSQQAETIRSILVPAINRLAEATKANGAALADLPKASNVDNSGKPGGLASNR